MMPAWLPHVVNVNGDWERVLKRLYAIFEADFITGAPSYDGQAIIWDERKLDGRYDEGFWHLITKQDQNTGDRLPDFPRAERLPWCAPTILHPQDAAVRVWDYLEGSGRIRTYLWLNAWDYVIVLEKRNQRRGLIAFLVTAYHIDGAGTRRKLQRKFDQRVT